MNSIKNKISSLFIFLSLIAVSCKDKFCDDKSCSSASSQVAGITVNFSMDSLHGGFTQNQLRNVYVFTDNYKDSVQLTNPTYTILMDGPFSSKHDFIMFKNRNTGTINRFEKFSYYLSNPDCCPNHYNYVIKNFKFNDQLVDTISYSKPFKITVANN